MKRRGKEEDILPGLGLDNNQLFFLSFAQVRLSWTLVVFYVNVLCVRVVSS